MKFKVIAPYLNISVAGGHHGNQHSQQDNDGCDVIGSVHGLHNRHYNGGGGRFEADWRLYVVWGRW